MADERLSAEAIADLDHETAEALVAKPLIKMMSGGDRVPHPFTLAGVRTMRALIDRNKALEAERGIGVDDPNGDISDLSAILATRDAEIASLKAERERLIAAGRKLERAGNQVATTFWRHDDDPNLTRHGLAMEHALDAWKANSHE